MQINFENLAIKIQKKKIKNINLRIQHTGEIHLSAPIRTSEKSIYNFLKDKLLWIKTHVNRIQAQQQKEAEAIFYQGQAYKLVVHEGTTQEPVLDVQNLHLFFKTKPTELMVRTELKLWYRKQLAQILPDLFEKWEKIIQVKSNKVVIKLMKSRWGSCNPTKKYISINLRLIEKRLPCLEYVIVHELVHLLEASHNKRFHALMSRYLPNWKELREELKG